MSKDTKYRKKNTISDDTAHTGGSLVDDRSASNGTPNMEASDINGDDDNNEGFDDLSVETTRTVRSVESVNSNATVESVAGKVTSEMEDMMVIVGTEIPMASDTTERKLQKKDDQIAALKKLGNIARYPLDPKCCKDQFDAGRKKLKNIAKDRAKEREKEQRKMELIWDSVTFFKKKMQINRMSLREVLAKYEEDKNIEKKEWRTEYEKSITIFDEENYLRGQFSTYQYF